MITSPSMPTTSETRTTRRWPSRRRAICTISWIAEAICERTVAAGRVTPDMATMFSSRESASRGLFACTVHIEPSWPVFMAWSMSSASAPRTSPRMIRSGRIRSAFFTSIR